MLVFGLIVSFAVHLCYGQLSSTVNTSLGEIVGRRDILSNVYQYLGIPYAKSPTGERQFRPPVEKLPFTEAYQASSYGDACRQNTIVLEEYLRTSLTTDDGEVLAATLGNSEDCLFLNIFARDDSGDGNINSTNLKPVMVFIHGGNFIFGTGAAFKGERLAEQHNVVVVTLNYRLGAFGFLSDGNQAYSGNYGLLDQAMAVKWVASHIQAFGGDPNSITLFGDEAGGSSVHLHVLGADNQNSFQRAIIQSAHYDDAVWTQKQCEDQYTKFVEDLGLSNSDPTVNASAEEILISSEKFTWRPCLGSEFIQDSPQKLITKGNIGSGVDVLIGTNDDVTSGWSFDVESQAWLDDVTRIIISDSFPQLYGNITNETVTHMSQNYLQFYTLPDQNNLEAPAARSEFIDRVYSDQLFKTWVQEVSWETSKLCNCPVFNYRFSNPSGTAGLSSELPFIFGYMPRTGSNNQLSLRVRRMWTNFATTGNPNTPELVEPEWLPYETYSDQCRNSLNIEATNSAMDERQVVSRSWSFWMEYYNLLELSCSNDTSIQGPNQDQPSDDVNVCEASVKDVIGMNVSNEEAAIMLVVFISLFSVFALSTIIVTIFCCIYKNTAKRLRKRLQKGPVRGHDNPSAPEYKL